MRKQVAAMASRITPRHYFCFVWVRQLYYSCFMQINLNEYSIIWSASWGLKESRLQINPPFPDLFPSLDLCWKPSGIQLLNRLLWYNMLESHFDLSGLRIINSTTFFLYLYFVVSSYENIPPPSSLKTKFW